MLISQKTLSRDLDILHGGLDSSTSRVIIHLELPEELVPSFTVGLFGLDYLKWSV